jgi:hypothetical protein
MFCVVHHCVLLASLLSCLITWSTGAEPIAGAAGDVVADERDHIYQFFIPARTAQGTTTSGAYLWIPPATPAIRAVMVGIHNGLPVTILQHPLIRALCRRHGIAQILLTPNGSDIGPVMLKDLNFDITDPQKTAVYDYYLQALAEASHHPELLTAPIVPLAHSAYASFPLDAAMRRPAQCLAAIPIKAGMPDIYAFYGPGGKAKAPDATLCLRGVPLLFLDSAAQETVPGRWKGSPYPQLFEPNFMGNYRKDSQDHTGGDYRPRNELAGAHWDMLSGHFDLHERNLRFIADWLDAIASARLPRDAGAPLKTLTLADGWLMDPRVPRSGELPATYAQPAPYGEFRGERSRALWFPTEALARGLLDILLDATRRQIEVFTVRDAQGEPVALSESPMMRLKEPTALLSGAGVMTISTYHFTEPPPICTNQERDHTRHELGNPLFPGRTTLAVSDLPLHLDPNSGPLRVIAAERFRDARGVTETRFTARLIRTRLTPDAGFQMLFPRLWQAGDERFLPTGRTLEISWSLTNVPGSKDQTVTFPPIADAPAGSPRIALTATSSAGLPVDYVVIAGPAVIVDGALVPCEVPAGANHPLPVLVGAYQVGEFHPNGGFKPTAMVYQRFNLVP